jgi:dihydroorotate dehydrogenase
LQFKFCTNLKPISEYTKERIFISPPFGNYIKTPVTTSIKGSFTWHKRKGLIKQVLKTVRPIKGGYVNAIGLRNKGLQNINLEDLESCYSVVGMEEIEWDNIIDYIPNYLKLEVNIGCPNSWGKCFTKHHLQRFVKKFPNLVLKLPATTNLDDIKYYTDHGVRKLHLCNTLPTTRGGESGARLKQFVLPLISEVKEKFPKIFVIAGGGIYSLQDAEDYNRCGADAFSLSTVWFNPFKGAKLVESIYRSLPNKNEVLHAI